MNTPLLFDIPKDAPSYAARLTAFKAEHGILTHRARLFAREDHPWSAMLPLERDRGRDMADIMAESCRIYDEAGRVVTGTGELAAVRTLCENFKIPCPL